MPTVAACLIVRNEEDNLDACLEALEPWVDEICVVDTGSTDRSVEIAQGYGARIGHFEWCEDFAAARNVALDLAQSDWILSVDADELLDPESAAGLRDLLRESDAMPLGGPQAFLVWIDNLDGSRDANGKPGYHSVGLARLFRRRPEIRWQRPVHESVMNSLLALEAGTLQHSHLRLVHHGYLPDAVRAGRKHERNLGILLKGHAEDPQDLFNNYKLACTHLALGDEASALGLMAPSWELAHGLADRARAQLPFLPLLSAELIRLLASNGELGRARQVAREACADFPTVSEVLYRSAEVCRAIGALEESSDLYVRARGCEAWTDLYHGQPASRAQWPLLGLSKVSALAGDLELAQSCLDRAFELAPKDVSARALSVRLMSVAGREAEAWGELGDLLSEAPGEPDVLLLAAEMAWAKGEEETARGFWQGALGHSASRQAAKSWLAIAALIQGDFERAEELRAEILAVDLLEAGALVVLAGIRGEVLELDPHFQSEALLGEVSAWLGELSRDPKGRALEAFGKGAGALAGVLPGVESLLLST